MKKVKHSSKRKIEDIVRSSDENLGLTAITSAFEDVEDTTELDELLLDETTDLDVQKNQEKIIEDEFELVI
mgnify:FL=1